MQKKIRGKAHLTVCAAVTGGFALTGIALGSLAGFSPYLKHQDGQHERKSTEAPVASQGKLCQDLFLAIDHRDTAGVQALLKQGADPNSRNGLGFAPLYIA